MIEYLSGVNHLNTGKSWVNILKIAELFESNMAYQQLDADELDDLLNAVEYEQEEINSASYTADDQDQPKLAKDHRALEAVAYVIKNNQRALANPRLAANSIFLYDYNDSMGDFGVAAVHIEVDDQVAHVKWLGSYGKSGKRLLMFALQKARAMGATQSVVEAKWASEGFYHKLGYDVEHRGEYNPFSDSNLVRMKKPLEEKWSTKYKKSIDCSHPKGFSQRAHCAARKARQSHKPTKSKAVK